MKECEYCTDLDDKGCNHCGTPHGSERDMIIEEQEEQLLYDLVLNG